jgi:hypothetical protein
MDRLQFTRSVVVDGQRFQAGDEIDDEAIPVDHLESCLRVGHLVRIPAKVFQSVPEVLTEPDEPEIEAEVEAEAEAEAEPEAEADAEPEEPEPDEPDETKPKASRKSRRR